MHGRLKVRTTAEQDEAKRLEREKKLKAFTAAKERIFTKRRNDELDEEALHLTAKVLGSNPDFYTLWNFRKEIFEKLKEERPTEKMKELCVQELTFLQNCLQVNPKSYGVWHHRCWIMTFMPEPDWKNELSLCTLYLKHDERNFHCWDYRRFVVSKSQVSPTEEFKFTTDKIKENFSNYSSWHYRSKLLPLIYPADPPNGGIQEEQLMTEFDLAQNACFTDPYDSSAWFYHRWLLGRATPDLAITCLHGHVTETGRVIMLVRFSKQVQSTDLYSSVVTIDDEMLEGKWRNPSNNSRPSAVWVFESLLNKEILQADHILMFCLDENMKQQVEIPAGSCEGWFISSAQANFLFRTELTAVHSSVLEMELESCNLLLEEEPDSKWTMLTMVLLMRAINPVKHAEETEKILNKLCEVDLARKGYYQDMRRKFQLENAIEKHCTTYPGFKELRSLVHMEQLVLVQSLDLSHNELTSLDNVNMLQCLRHLNVDNNNLDKILDQTTALQLHRLETISLRNNNINNINSLRCLQLCKNLKILNISGNPLCNSQDFKEKINKILPDLQITDDEILS